MNARETVLLTQEIITAASNLCKQLNYWEALSELADDVIASQERLEKLLSIYQQENNE